MNNKKSIKGSSSGLNKKIYLLGFILVIAAIAVWVLGNKSVKSGDPADRLANDFNVKANIPQENMGDLNAVPQEKIDSLFSNLKQ